MLGASLALTSCGGEQQEGGSDMSGSIQIDGSSTVYPITEAVAEEYRAEAPDVKVTVGVSGTGGGMKKFTRGEIDIVNASRAMNASEEQTAGENGISFVQLSVAYDGLTVVVH
ncbi:MAG: substrate-binding domain-containing protein, partial [Hymenobacteraceae bacterium]|nr:substrate-binding domain-containing protein [Hymenobacteraceae bacterium]